MIGYFIENRIGVKKTFTYLLDILQTTDIVLVQKHYEKHVFYTIYLSRRSHMGIFNYIEITNYDVCKIHMDCDVMHVCNYILI